MILFDFTVIRGMHFRKEKDIAGGNLDCPQFNSENHEPKSIRLFFSSQATSQVTSVLFDR